MSWQWRFDIAAGGFVALSVAGVIFAPLMLRFANWRSKSTNTVIIFRKPSPARNFLGLLGIWLIVAPLLLASGYPNDWVLASSMLVFAVPMALFALWVAMQRYELRLDLQTRTYRLTRGLLLLPKIKPGSWEDFGGVFVRANTARSGEIYAVGLTWRTGGGGRPYLYSGTDRAKAEAEAESISKTLGLPSVAAPPPEGLRALA